MNILSTDFTHTKYRVVCDANDYLLVDKPSGSSVHRDGDVHSLLDSIRTERGLDYLAPVHRLDKLTSGLWLLAKHPAAAAELSAEFAQRRVGKFYLAISDRRPTKKQGRVEGALLKSRGGSYRLARQGKPWSQTQFFSFSLSKGQRLFLLRPLTGRTHQLRVVMKSLGSPILGDTRYYAGPTNVSGEVDRCYLHAYALRFRYQGEDLRFLSAPVDGALFTSSECARRLSELTEPWNLPWPGNTAQQNQIK